MTGMGGLRALVVDVEEGQRTVKRRLRETGLDKSDRISYLRVPDGSRRTQTPRRSAGSRDPPQRKSDIVLADLCTSSTEEIRMIRRPPSS